MKKFWCGVETYGASQRAFFFFETRKEDFSSGGCFFCITPCAAA